MRGKLSGTEKRQLILHHLSRCCHRPLCCHWPHCHIGVGVVVGPHAILERDVHLAENCRIAAHCWLGHTVIGPFVKVGQNSVIGKRGLGFDGQGADLSSFLTLDASL